jgi:serine/threonine protein kinase
VEPVRALRLSAEACRALEVLHENDIIHRDVTPGNLLLSRSADGTTSVLIADLGVAKSLIDAVGATMTAGTPSYMAPEQAKGEQPLDRRADVYSLTAVAYALLTGSPPYPVKTIADIIARDPAAAPAPIAARLGAPASLDSVMVAGLATDRNRRPPTALLLAQGLEAIADQMAAGGVTAPSPRPTPPPVEETVVTNPPPASSRPPEPVLPSAAYPSSAPSHPPAGYPAGPGQPDPYAMSVIGTTEELSEPPRRGLGYYLLLGVAALALFAISMFLTILVLS